MIYLAALVAALAAFFLALLGTPVARRVALSTGFVDVPKQSRHHQQPTPLLGGAAMLLAILMPSLLALALASMWQAQVPSWVPAGLAIHIGGAVTKAPAALGILGGAVALHVVGLIDDRRRVGPWLKLIAQLAVAAGVVSICGIRLLEAEVGRPLSTAGSILWIVLITNTFNFLDNVDGLAAGVAVICGGALLAAAAAAGQMFVGAWLCLLIGAAAGFLVHNFPPAKIFMGDAGSMVLGYLLGVLSILTTYYSGGPSGYYYSIFAPLVLLAVPLYDTFSVVTLRIQERRNPMVGDTRHFSHRLLRRGMGPRKAVLTIYLATAATATGASLLPHVNRTGAILVFAQTIGIVLIIALLESAEGPARRRSPPEPP